MGMRVVPDRVTLTALVPIQQLKGPAKWTYYYLYVILDIFSRSVVGWMIVMRRPAPLPGGLSPPRARSGDRRSPARPARRSGSIHEVKAGGSPARRHWAWTGPTPGPHIERQPLPGDGPLRTCRGRDRCRAGRAPRGIRLSPGALCERCSKTAGTAGSEVVLH